MKNQNRKIQIAKTVTHFALLGLAAVVLVKIYKTADQYDKLGKKINAEGVKSLF
jgi:hypothetical protein